MKRRLPIVPFLLAAVCAHASAAGPDTAVVIDCAHPTLPSQRAVGDAMAQPNPGQAYATRARLMSEARRACRREHAASVRLVREAPLPRQHRLAGSVSYR